jgi:hypothetical protein
MLRTCGRGLVCRRWRVDGDGSGRCTRRCGLVRGKVQGHPCVIDTSLLLPCGFASAMHVCQPKGYSCRCICSPPIPQSTNHCLARVDSGMCRFWDVQDGQGERNGSTLAELTRERAGEAFFAGDWEAGAAEALLPKPQFVLLTQWLVFVFGSCMRGTRHPGMGHVCQGAWQKVKLARVDNVKRLDKRMEEQIQGGREQGKDIGREIWREETTNAHTRKHTRHINTNSNTFKPPQQHTHIYR